MMKPLRLWLLSLTSTAILASCGGTPVTARYPPREDGCAVKAYPVQPVVPFDELGVVEVDCPREGPVSCERLLENAACRRGGDIVWGIADNALNASRLVAHAAHTKLAGERQGERGCALQVFKGAPPMRTQNIGPVTALCAEDDSRETCSRELEDQACLMGADVLWQIDGPTQEDTQNGTKQRMNGRAAHTLDYR